MKSAKGITFTYDQDQPVPADAQTTQPASGADYRAEGPKTYSKTPSDDGGGIPPGNPGFISPSMDQKDPSSAKVIPDQMKEDLRDQQTYMQASGARVASRYVDLTGGPSHPTVRKLVEWVDAFTGIPPRQASLKMEVLPRGAILYRGTPYGGDRKFPRSEAAWFTPDREVALDFANESWAGKALGYAEKAEKTPSVRKYRVKTDLRLPSILHSDVASIIAHYAALAGLGDQRLLEHAISEVGTSSAAEFGYWGSLRADDAREDFEDIRLFETFRTLGSKFKNLGELLKFLCQKTSFQGWVANYSDGGSEVLLCDPKSVLSASARQPPLRNKKERELQRQKELQEEQERYDPEWEAERAELDRKEQQKDEFYRKRSRVFELFGIYQPENKIDYSSSETQELLRDWKKYLSSNDLKMFGSRIRRSPAWGRRGSRLAAMVTPSKLPDGYVVDIEGDFSYLFIGLRSDTGRAVGNVHATRGSGGIWRVKDSDADRGYGPLLYDVAMEMVNELDDKGLARDTDTTSGAAERVWEHYARRPDVERFPLDDVDRYGPDSALSFYYKKRGIPFLRELSKRGMLVSEDIDLSVDTTPPREASSRSKVAVRMGEILQSTGPGIISKGGGVQLTPKRFSMKKGFWVFTATGSKGEEYTVRLKAVRKGRTLDVKKLDLQVSCTCPYWQWQGPEHWGKSQGYLYGKPHGSASKPDLKDPTGDHWICKHVAAALKQAWTYSLEPLPRGKKGSFEIAGPLPSPERVASRFAGIKDLRPNERITVYHGTSLKDTPTLINGFDANKVVYRHYGGPRHAGLFVAPDANTAERFAHYGQVILEIEVKAKNLHGTDYSGNIGTEYEEETWRDKFPDSFRPYLSQTLTQSSEPQALLRGLVRPSQIKSVRYKPYKEQPKWYTRKQFLDLGLKYEQPYQQPVEIKDVGWDLSYPNYSLDEFIQAYASTLGMSEKRVREHLKDWMWERRTEDAVRENLENAGFGPTATRGFVKRMERAWGPAGSKNPHLRDAG